ncbi:hypothetical protein KSC_023730 [Ktedonobacter sp. SOSP1-52]|nr:hypothetical protein [Ktedonobacter sp. SOSP1-52]GHO63481.1 hypothetical protein KSC_023730 [Ktedonobacter sp. SOSP1-52]
MVVADLGGLVLASCAWEEFNEVSWGDLEIDNPGRGRPLAIQTEGLTQTQLIAIEVQRVLQVTDGNLREC